MMGERFPATLAFESYRYLCIASNNGETLVIDSERHAAFHIAVHADYRIGYTFNLIAGIDAFVIKAFLSRAYRIRVRGNFTFCIGRAY